MTKRIPSAGPSPASFGPTGVPEVLDEAAFQKVLGMEFESIEPDRVVAWMELGPDHHTPWGVVHGGVYAAAIETAASLGASLAVHPRGQFAVGVNNNTDFLRPMVSGRVRVEAEPVQQGASQQLWQVDISRVDDGKLVARGHVRLHNRPLPGPMGD
jgi:1,4-dihydroxy-2-naphthoyl-CoA hydrolase